MGVLHPQDTGAHRCICDDSTKVIEEALAHSKGKMSPDNGLTISNQPIKGSIHAILLHGLSTIQEDGFQMGPKPSMTISEVAFQLLLQGRGCNRFSDWKELEWCGVQWALRSSPASLTNLSVNKANQVP